MRQGVVRIGFSLEYSVWMMRILATVFLLLLVESLLLLSYLKVSHWFSGCVSLTAATLHCKGEGGNKTCYRLRARYEWFCDTFRRLWILYKLLIFLFLGFINISYHIYCRTFLKIIAFSKFFVQGEESDEWRSMWMTLVRSSLSRNPEKKSLIKIFFLQNSCAVRGKILGKLKLVLKHYKLVHFDYLLVLIIVVLLTEIALKMYAVCLKRNWSNEWTRIETAQVGWKVKTC